MKKIVNLTKNEICNVSGGNSLPGLLPPNLEDPVEVVLFVANIIWQFITQKVNPTAG